MKKVLMFGLGLFLMVFMVGDVIADSLEKPNATKIKFNNYLGNDKSGEVYFDKSYHMLTINFSDSIYSSSEPYEYAYISLKLYPDSAKVWLYNFEKGYFQSGHGEVELRGAEESYKGSFTGISEINNVKFSNKKILSYKGNAVFISENSRIEGRLEVDISGLNKTSLNELSAGDFVKLEDVNFTAFFSGFKTKKKDNEQKITDLETNISLLESWKETIEDTLTDILTTLTGLITKTDNHETRIETLENQNPTCSTCSNETFPSYLNYLSSSDRKKILCGHAEENRLTNIKDLGYNCSLEYRTLRSGKERVKCRCKKL